MITLYKASFDKDEAGELIVYTDSLMVDDEKLGHGNVGNSLLARGWRTTEDGALSTLRKYALRAIEKAEDDLFIGIVPPKGAQ
mgnify:CR=1 FL=1